MKHKKNNKRTALIIIAAVLVLAGCGKKPEPAGTDEPKPAEEIPVIKIEDDGIQDQDIADQPAQSAGSEDSSDISGAEDSTAEEAVPSKEDSFYAEDISDELFERMKGRSFPEGCTTKREDLRYLHLLYKDLDGTVHEGEMVCNESIADSLIDIFEKLYDADYPIEHMALIDDYDGDDDASMSANNTSCFNYRIVSDTDHLSRHAYGLAIDLNPLYNPYIRQKDGKEIVEPAEGEPYADRSRDFDYKIDKDDLAYKLFTQAGFTWGGSWKSVKDYQHFEMR